MRVPGQAIIHWGFLPKNACELINLFNEISIFHSSVLIVLARVMKFDSMPDEHRI